MDVQGHETANHNKRLLIMHHAEAISGLEYRPFMNSFCQQIRWLTRLPITNTHQENTQSSAKKS